ncbi:cytochrome c [Aggregicoccus sp. 17bor-14]|uniref:c-type cytochrome n=1 Tax=Myxococcaceae TaxID=31 RepID=UPI00129CC2FC|nr:MULTISPECIES: cytochrome c [Myxococcaceae]MBF5043245.1 cytochrome c [Simulacricoccus sp. 17bor-14]MRI89002.1 cytochrome c [Aggregicoccus sp. 17bor-14]
MTRSLLLALALLFTAHAQAAEPDAAELWAAKCKNCHGPDGRAQTKVGQKERIDDFSEAAWQQHHSDDHLRKVIRDGSPDNKKMKAYKDKLTPEQIDALVKYIRTLKR